VQANYEQKINESALLGMVQENVAAQAVIKAFSLQRRTLGWFTMRNDDARRKNCSGGIPVDHGRAHGHDLRVVAAPRGAGARRYLATKGQITIGTFVTFESAFWKFPTTSPI